MMYAKFYKNQHNYGASLPGPKDYPTLVVFCTGRTPSEATEELFRKEDVILGGWTEVEPDEVPDEWLAAFAKFGMERPVAKTKIKAPKAPKAKPEPVSLVVELEPSEHGQAMAGMFILGTFLLFSLMVIVRLIGVVWHAS